MKRCIAVLGLACFAFPGAALAAPAPEDPRLDPRIQSGSLGVPPHLAGRHPSQLPAVGTDVAAPDQQASKLVVAPASASDTSGFDWSDAGIGAAGAVTLLGISLAGGMVVVRRRQTRGPSALAG
jgi:hypothetical protein